MLATCNGGLGRPQVLITDVQAIGVNLLELPVSGQAVIKVEPPISADVQLSDKRNISRSEKCLINKDWWVS